jgi:hypothetical protein
MLRAAAKRLGTPSDAARRAHAAFYANHVLTRCGGLAHQVTHGPRDVIGAMSMEASVQPHIGR